MLHKKGHVPLLFDEGMYLVVFLALLIKQNKTYQASLWLYLDVAFPKVYL
jgi:hypothetical protein